jgi:subtilisin family serine protease
MSGAAAARWLAGLLVALAAGAGAPAVQAKAQATADEALVSRQVLVMLRMPPPHFHAGADYGGYGAGSDPGQAARRRAAQDLARAHSLRVVDAWPMPVIGVDCYVMEGLAAAEAGLLASLARDPRVAWAQPVNLFHGMGQGDPLLPLQPDDRAWHLAALHRLSTGRGVRVALIDSGVDSAHPDLSQQVELRENFVGEGDAPPEAHGTAVAGIIAARAGNGLGIAGVAPGARIMALRACWETADAQGRGQGARCSSFTLAKALNFAILHEARVINLSLGGPADRLLQTLVETAAVRGATAVGAADPGRPDGFPAAVPGVLAVAMAPPGRPAAAATLLAPGADVPTCLPGARWGFVSGTSYAAAHVSGLVALLAQLLPHAGPATLRSHIVTGPGTGTGIGTVSATLEHAAAHGAPRPSGVTIDACASIARTAGTCVCSCQSIDKLEARRAP